MEAAILKSPPRKILLLVVSPNSVWAFSMETQKMKKNEVKIFLKKLMSNKRLFRINCFTNKDKPLLFTSDRQTFDGSVSLGFDNHLIISGRQLIER